MNWFGYDSAAERYAKGRPYFHPAVVRRVREVLGLTDLLDAALDVGCGTGLSSLALKDAARRVVGVDPSATMILHGARDPALGFAVAAGERLPFGAGRFDLVALSQAFHWLDRAAFFGEARRVLRPEGWLVVYDNFFAPGQPPERGDFSAWFGGAYVERYPSPPRGALSFGNAEELAAGGFRLQRAERHQGAVELTREGLVDYLVSQTNVIAAVEGGREPIERTRDWLRENTARFFGEAEKGEFRFAGPLWILRRTS
jgi:SAM-dependent methyltransferase